MDFIVRIKEYLLDAVCPATAMEIQIDVKMVLENVLTVSTILLGRNVSTVKMVILEMLLKVPAGNALAHTQTDLQLAVWQMVKKSSVSAKKATLELAVSAVLLDILEIHKNMKASVRNVTVIIMDSWLAVTT